MNDFNLGNPKWKHIELAELYKSTKAQRSNCLLSDSKISKLNLKLPDTIDSLRRCITAMKEDQDAQCTENKKPARA